MFSHDLTCICRNSEEIENDFASFLNPPTTIQLFDCSSIPSCLFHNALKTFHVNLFHDDVELPKQLFNCLSLVSLNCQHLSNIETLEGLHNLASLQSLVIATLRIPAPSSEIEQLTNLQHLELTNLPARSIGFIRSLKMLTSLVVNRTGLQTLTKHIDELRNLETLRIHKNPLTELPHNLSRCQNLKTLEITSCHNIEKVPNLSRLQLLTVLNLSSCDLERIPSSIIHCRALKHLFVQENPRVSRVPAHFEQLANLETLNLSETRIEHVPEKIRFLNRLTTLGLAGTMITELPLWITSLPALTSVDVSDTQIEEQYHIPFILFQGEDLDVDDLSMFDDEPVINLPDYHPDTARRPREVTRQELAASPGHAALLYAPGAMEHLQLRSRAIKRTH